MTPKWEQGQWGGSSLQPCYDHTGALMTRTHRTGHHIKHLLQGFLQAGLI